MKGFCICVDWNQRYNLSYTRKKHMKGEFNLVSIQSTYSLNSVGLCFKVMEL